MSLSKRYGGKAVYYRTPGGCGSVMTSKLQLEMRSADLLELQLLCSCCGQPYYPNKAWEDRLRAIIFGSEQYANCPSCTQAVSEELLHDEDYRQRCRDTFAKWHHAFGVVTEGVDQDSQKPEPTYAELKAQIAEIKRKMRNRLQFRASEKGGVSVYGLGRFPVTLYYEQWIRLLDKERALREFLETNKAKLKIKE